MYCNCGSDLKMIKMCICFWILWFYLTSLGKSKPTTMPRTNCPLRLKLSSRCAPKFDGFLFGPFPILPSGFVELHPAVFVQSTNQHGRKHNFLGGGNCSSTRLLKNSVRSTIFDIQMLFHKTFCQDRCLNKGLVNKNTGDGGWFSLKKKKVIILFFNWLIVFFI